MSGGVEDPLSDRESESASKSRSRSWLRRPGVLYTYTDHQHEIVKELARLLPDDGPVLDLSAFEPGTESVELIAQRLLETFLITQDERAFLAFCKVNASRLQDWVLDRIDEEGWPLDSDEILAEIYYRVFRRCRSPVDRDSVSRLGGSRTVYRLLVTIGREVMGQRVEDFRVMKLPLPGMPVIPTAPAPSIVNSAKEIIARNGWVLGQEQLNGWVSFVLLNMDRSERRLLHLRELRNLKIKEIARLLGSSTFEIAQQIKAAHQEMRERILALVEAFETDKDDSGQPLRVEEQGDQEDPDEGEEDRDD